MKKNYERKSLIIFSIFLFIAFEIFIVSLYFNNSYRTFERIDAIVVTDNYVKTYIDNTSLKRIRSASKFYIDDKIYKYKVINVEKNVIKKNSKVFNEVMLKFDFKNKYKDNDTISISIFSKKKKIYNIFKSCWESE